MGYVEEEITLDDTDSSDSLLEHTGTVSKAKSWFPRLRRFLLVGVCVAYAVLSSTAMVVMYFNRLPEPYSPAGNVLSYGRRPLYFGEDSKYAGLPESVDEAWDSLLEPINIRITEEELRQAHTSLSEDIVQLVDGDYVSVLSVYHELHCLDALRRNIFHDYYFSNMTVEDAEYNIVHMTHCVDTIRRSLMCKADIAIYTAYWIGDQHALPSKELRSESDTICVNWEAIEEWSRERLLPRDRYKVRPGPYEKGGR